MAELRRDTLGESQNRNQKYFGNHIKYLLGGISMMRGAKYSTLHQDDQQQQHSEDEEKQRKADRMERINVKATALAWVVVAAVVAYYSDIVNIGLSDEKVNRWAFNIAVVSFVSNFCIMIYVTVWVRLYLNSFYH